MATAIRPEKILKDLANLWVDLAKEESDKNSAGVLRACAMTLIVAVEEHRDAQSVGETIAELMHEHPSRAIVLHVQQDAAGEDLNARVFAQCWMPFGRRQQICCEEIEITTPVALLADVPKLMLGLTVPDLPVVLWVRCLHLAMHAEFQKLFPLASKIVVDSDCFEDKDAAYNFIADMNRHGKNVVDLAWTRLTRCREMVAGIFEDDRYRPYLEKIATVTLNYAGDPATEDPKKVPPGARYLASWFQHALPHVNVVLKPANASRGAAVGSIELSGGNFSAAVKLDEPGAAVLRINELIRRTAMPPLTEQALLREELSIIGVDPIFRRCFD